MTSHHRSISCPQAGSCQLLGLVQEGAGPGVQPGCCVLNPNPDLDLIPMDFHLIANFAALALITLAGPAVIFILFYRRGAL